MATTLIALPDETLSQIFSYVDSNKAKRCNQRYRQTICALTQTNRRLSNIARGELYRHITFDVDEGRLAPWTTRPTFVGKFLRTCQERTGLLHSMRHLDITWNLDEDEDDLLEAVLCQLARSMSLTHLRLSVQEIDFELSVSPCVLRPLLQRDQGFLQLQVLEVTSLHESDIMPAEILYGLASLPSLQTLYVCCSISRPEEDVFCTSPQSTAFGEALDLKDQSFSLETLEIVKSVRNDVLELILSRCPKLKQLTALPVGLVDDENSSDFFYGNDADSTTNYVSPKKLSTSLLPIRSTLQSLTLGGKPSHAPIWNKLGRLLLDNSIIRLSPFKSLTRLEISVALLAQDNPKTLEPDALRTMFPISLEHLEFQLGYPNGLFWSATSPSTFFHAGATYNVISPVTPDEFINHFTQSLIHDSARIRADLGWYLSLLSTRKKSLSLSLPDNDSQFGSSIHNNHILPNLRSLRVVELHDSSDTWDHLEFVGCGYCPEVFWELGLEFEVVLRVPKGWNPSQE